MQWQYKVNHALNYTFPTQNNTLHTFLGIEKSQKQKRTNRKRKLHIYVPALKPSIKFAISPELTHHNHDQAQQPIDNAASDS